MAQKEKLIRVRNSQNASRHRGFFSRILMIYEKRRYWLTSAASVVLYISRDIVFIHHLELRCGAKNVLVSLMVPRIRCTCTRRIRDQYIKNQRLNRNKIWNSFEFFPRMKGTVADWFWCGVTGNDARFSKYWRNGGIGNFLRTNYLYSFLISDSNSVVVDENDDDWKSASGRMKLLNMYALPFSFEFHEPPYSRSQLNYAKCVTMNEM